MINSFILSKLPLIFFGPGKVDQLPHLIKSYGKKILLVTGRSSFLNSPAGMRFCDIVKNEGLEINILLIPGEPSDSIIDNAVSVYRNDQPHVIVAIGGGSVMDAGKAISAMIPVEGVIKNYLEGVGHLDHPGHKIPLIAVPTTSGTGSEVTKNAVISGIGKSGFKKSLRHDNFVPDIAVIDPSLTLSCSPDITAASGMDCFTQLTEAYLSTKSNEYTDALAIEGLKAVRSSIVKAYHDGHDIEARTGMSFAALTSGICLANAGLGVVHGFASAIGGLFDVPHGLVCGTLMAVANEITVKRLREQKNLNPGLDKYAILAKLFLNDTGKKDDNQLIDEFIDYLHNLTAELRLPGLKEAGVSENTLQEIAQITECKNNPVKLDSADLLNILNRRFL